MANGTTRWRPDTCGCVVVYSWATDAASGEPVIHRKKFEAVCPKHTFARDDDARFEAVKADNRKAAG